LPQRVEDPFTHDLGQGTSKDIGYRRLRDGRAATRILELQAGNEVDDNREIVGGRRTVQNLGEGWPRTRGGVAGKSMKRDAGGMAEKLAKRDMRSPISIRGNTPGGQILLDVAIQGDPTVLHQPHRTKRKNGFADRSGLKQRVGAGRVWVAVGPCPEPALPGNATFIDDGNANARRGEMGHAVGQ
jgi:hypothetical protein